MNISDIKHLISEKTATFLARGTHPLLIDGQWVQAESGQTIDVINPANEEVIAKVASAGKAEVDKAVAAARRAFDQGPWGKMRGAERERLLMKLADLLEANAQSFAEVESLDNGKSAAMAQAVDVAVAVDTIRYMAGWASKIEGATTDISVPFAPQAEFVTFTRREAVGVVAAIVAWNFPLLLAV
jgi:phenylacetaldehyde dehydrogenase